MGHKRIIILILVLLVLGLGSFGVRINSVIANVPSAPIPISPLDNIYLSDQMTLTNITFKWSSVNSATGYSFQLSSVQDFSSLIVNYSTPATEFVFLNANLTPGKYYWRVSAFNAEGNSLGIVVSFSILPAPPTVSSPANNAFVLPDITFMWTTLLPLDVQFQLSNKPDFSVILTDAILKPNLFLFRGYGYKINMYLPLSMYWWRVRTKIGTEFSPWITQSFTVMLPPSIAPTIIAPSLNIVPINRVDLKWSYINNADRYEIQVNQQDSTILDTVVYHTSEYTFDGKDNTIYYFRVRAGNPVGWGPWSEWKQLRILLPPKTPDLSSPLNGAIIQNTNSITLSWSPIATADFYLVQINDQIFKVNNNTLTFIGQWKTNYLWRVKAQNVSGESPWSSYWTFTINENIPPSLEINSYSQYTNQNSIVISGKVYDLESGIDALYCGSTFIPISANGNFQFNLSLKEGANTFSLIALDKAGNRTQKTINIYLDTTPPDLEITFPVASLYPTSDVFTVIEDIEIKGVIKDILPVTLIINNTIVPVQANGMFVYQTKLNYGNNQIYLRVTDAAQNVTEKVIKVYKTFNPKFIFKINDPRIFVQVIDKNGKLTWDVQEIDPGRYTVPVIMKGRVFIPIRKFIELIGGTTEWNANEKKVTITVSQRGKVIELWIGKPLARVTDSYGNQQWIQIEKGDNSIVPFIKNGRSYFPLRFIVEQLNAKVDWDQVLQQVTIEFPIVP